MNQFLSQLQPNDVLSILNAVGVVCAIIFAGLMHLKCKDMHNRVAALENTQPPAADQVIEMYDTAQRVLTSVNKMLARTGRSNQAKAAAIDAAIAAQDTPPAPQPTKTLVGASSRPQGGLIRPGRPPALVAPPMQSAAQ